MTANDIIITDITLAASGNGIQFYLHVVGQERNTILVEEQLLAALNVRP